MNKIMWVNDLVHVYREGYLELIHNNIIYTAMHYVNCKLVVEKIYSPQVYCHEAVHKSIIVFLIEKSQFVTY